MATGQRALRTITCKGCGATVTKRIRAGQMYCSHTCWRSSPRPERRTGLHTTCAVCAKAVYIPKSRIGKPHYFCSPAHHDEWQGRNKTVHTCKICKGEFRWSPSRTLSGKYNPTYCSPVCRDADPARREMLIGMNAIQQRGNPTRIERIGYGMLDELAIFYEPQFLIGGKFCVDAFLPLHNTVIQFDGDYWHGNPKVFPTPDSRQKRRAKLDASQDAYMRKCGYTVLRIWEADIHKRPDAVRKRLRQFA